ncbi:GGDEF domain-containing protein [Actinoplanes friuliensis]|uniref:Cellulose synthesis regulatory protein n=1 Tax=Actinoplanes friuliensis DSM 7358 TaxID=1246995 RepID=U5W2D0_9ACTN|nr:diguanylate cyclase [Actinoplanes friuliensis]AGZ42056.1 Cellulose synthesis regulatory protein [Actinoplanes friuliensis DSM 7358]
MTTTHAPADARRLADELLTLEIGFAATVQDDRIAAGRIQREAVALGRTDLVLRARVAEIVVLLREGDTAGGGRAIHQVHPEAVELGDDYLLARCHRALSIFFRQLGDLATALAHAVQCMSHTADDVVPAIRARHLMCLAVLLDETGSPGEALRRFGEALEIATVHRDAELALLLLNNMTYTACVRGDLAAAEDLERRMRFAARSAGVPLSATCLDTCARVAMLAGRYADVEVILGAFLTDDAPKHLLDEGNALEEAMLTAAEAQRELGNDSRAQAILDRVLRLCAEHDLPGLQARAREQQALVHAAAGRYREAFEEYRRFHTETQVLTSAQQDARSRTLQAVHQAEEARRATDEFRELAHRDALTGLHNRRHVDEALPVALGVIGVRGGWLSVALIDLDHFKRVNDTRSHETGDLVLRDVADLLLGTAPDDAVVGRLGGEEFVVLLPGADATAAWIAAERIRLAVAGHDWAPVTGGLPVTCSVGVTSVRGPGPAPAAVLAAADRNLYAAKRGGRDRVCGDPVTSS